jgi:hypothetical protein
MKELRSTPMPLLLDEDDSEVPILLNWTLLMTTWRRALDGGDVRPQAGDELLRLA